MVNTDSARRAGTLPTRQPGMVLRLHCTNRQPIRAPPRPLVGSQMKPHLSSISSRGAGDLLLAWLNARWSAGTIATVACHGGSNGLLGSRYMPARSAIRVADWLKTSAEFAVSVCFCPFFL